MDDLEGWEWLKGMYNTQLNEESLRDKVKKKNQETTLHEEPVSTRRDMHVVS
jgi:hypothetical protein